MAKLTISTTRLPKPYPSAKDMIIYKIIPKDLCVLFIILVQSTASNTYPTIPIERKYVINFAHTG
ncbi:MAG: hypothetical protein HRT98_00905 [Mycoplasmatales bacterium]|nr:hypothetical protein [Mycoplasmatales bacterium]